MQYQNGHTTEIAQFHQFLLVKACWEAAQIYHHPTRQIYLWFNGKNIACIELGHSGHKKVRVCKYDDDDGLHLGVYSLLADLVGPTLYRGH